MDILLLIHNIGYVLSILMVIALSALVLAKGQNRRQAFLLMGLNVCVFIFALSHVIGVNIADSELSRVILLANVVNFFISIFFAHCAISLFEKEKEQRYNLALIYTFGIGLFGFMLFNLDLFLLESRPKMYFPNYYEGGPLYIVMMLYALIVAAYVAFQSVRAFLESRRGSDAVFYNRVKYVATGNVLAILFGYPAFLLVMNIEVDPLWSPLHFIYVPFFVYAMVKYRMLDITLVAQKAAIYGLGIGAVTLLIGLSNYINSQLIAAFPHISFWMIPLLSSVVAVLVGHIVWKKIRETDVLKYEFITIVSHKFRTPLTHIKWALAQIKQTESRQEQEEILEQVHQSTEHVLALTNALVDVAGNDTLTALRSRTNVNVSALVKRYLENNQTDIRAKQLSVTSEISDDMYVAANENRIEFVVEVLISNALAYTPVGGSITIRLFEAKNKVVFEVTDTGIGIEKNKQKLIFQKFFRGDEAQRMDTEGLGIGLSIAKDIVAYFSGDIECESEGAGKGATFTVTFPQVTP